MHEDMSEKNGNQCCIVAIGGCITTVLVQSVTDQFNFLLKHNTASGENQHLLCPTLCYICRPLKDIRYSTMLSF